MKNTSKISIHFYGQGFRTTYFDDETGPDNLIVPSTRKFQVARRIVPASPLKKGDIVSIRGELAVVSSVSKI